MDKSEVFIRLAHFTVKEFLFSQRLWENAKEHLRFFALSQDLVHRIFLTTALNGALSYTGPEAEVFDPYLNLYDYLIYHGYKALTRWNLRIETKHRVSNLALKFLHPDESSFKRLSKLLDRLDDTMDLESRNHDIRKARLIFSEQTQ